MNANVTSLKVAVCGAMALALTMASGWMFVESAAVVRVNLTPAQMVAFAGTHGASSLVKSAATGLLQ